MTAREDLMSRVLIDQGVASFETGVEGLAVGPTTQPDVVRLALSPDRRYVYVAAISLSEFMVAVAVLDLAGVERLRTELDRLIAFAKGEEDTTSGV